MRRIFSTVFGPHEPAFTVGSLAISATRRPSIVARPVTTPSAPRPSSFQLASSASSAKEPASTRRSTRSRTGSLPCSAVFSWWRCGPPASAASSALANSVTAREPIRLGAVPVDRARRQHVGAERPAEHLLRRARGLDQPRQVDPGLDPHLVQHRDDVLGRDVAGRARRHRAAAELAEARLEGVDALLQRGQHVGEALAAGVVEVGGQLDPAEPLARGGEELADLARVGHPGRVAEADLLRSRRRRAARRSRRPAPAAPRPRTGSRRRSRSPPRSAAPPRARSPASAPARPATPRSSG